MYDLTGFSLRDMTTCGSVLRKLGDDAASMEEAASRVVRHLYEALCAPGTTEPACALARFFVTVPYAELEPELQQFAQRVFPESANHPQMRCLTLLATAGAEATWNDRRSSAGHQALPLPSEEAVSRSPMIAQLIAQLGVRVSAVVSPAPDFVLATPQPTYNIFNVAEALGSPFIPAQREFVEPYGIRAVLGFGGMLPTGDLFATILFSRHPIPRETADMFKTLALNVKVAIMPFAGGRVFA